MGPAPNPLLGRKAADFEVGKGSWCLEQGLPGGLQFGAARPSKRQKREAEGEDGGEGEGEGGGEAEAEVACCLIALSQKEAGEAAAAEEAARDWTVLSQDA